MKTNGLVISYKWPVEGVTVGDLKKVLALMADDAIVCARDRDCITLEQINVVGVTLPPEFKQEYPSPWRQHATIEDVYGGDNRSLENPSKQAIIFCDND